MLREGNPRRLNGWALPQLGKIAPLDMAALEAVARRQLEQLGLPDPGESQHGTLILGLAESSLVPAWHLAQCLRAARSTTAAEPLAAGFLARPCDVDADFVSRGLGVELCLTTRSAPLPPARGEGPAWLSFLEPHSHAPCHFIQLPSSARAACSSRPALFQRIVVVEDEVRCGPGCALPALRFFPPRQDLLARSESRTLYDPRR